VTPKVRTAWAPGRVNLIGEHIDYHGLPVLPMALDRGIALRFAPNEARRVRLTTDLPDCGPVDLSLDAAPSPGPDGHWGNYVQAALRVARGDYGAHVGIDGVVTSTLPAAAGLSSSSALIVATTLALLAASGHAPGARAATLPQSTEPGQRTDPRLRLAEALAAGERHVGTAGGGMDQAASLLGQVGHVLRIGFAPLRVEPIAWPDAWQVVVADSGVKAEKSGEHRSAYNERRQAGARAAERIAAALGVRLPGGDLPGIDAPLWPTLLAERSADEIIAASGDEAPVAWVRHVVTEAARVDEAVARIRAVDGPGLGRLLDASHHSLAHDYEVSHPRVDALVETARTAGAWGARITGAGFGGCMIALCAADHADTVEEALRERLLAAAPPRAPLVFRAWPGAGAELQDDEPDV